MASNLLVNLAIIGVVIGMVFIHINPAAAAQPMGITITPTNTLEPPTNTPEPPTNTPELPTNTPEPPTFTPEPPTPTGTQITIVPPTSTFTPTPTGTYITIVPPTPGSKTPPANTQIPPFLPETGSGPSDPTQGTGYWLFAIVSLGILGFLFVRGFKRSRG
jgi:hypothetical protein